VSCFIVLLAAYVRLWAFSFPILSLWSLKRCQVRAPDPRESVVDVCGTVTAVESPIEASFPEEIKVTDIHVVSRCVHPQHGSLAKPNQLYDCFWFQEIGNSWGTQNKV
jgi:hypothetical protein